MSRWNSWPAAQGLGDDSPRPVRIWFLDFETVLMQKRFLVQFRRCVCAANRPGFLDIPPASSVVMSPRRTAATTLASARRWKSVAGSEQRDLILVTHASSSARRPPSDAIILQKILDLLPRLTSRFHSVPKRLHLTAVSSGQLRKGSGRYVVFVITLDLPEGLTRRSLPSLAKTMLAPAPGHVAVAAPCKRCSYS